jgi:SNF2 family DNA or RNA helicase
MVAREMLDRGLIRRVLVLCPAHLCDQWAQELSEKFGLHPAVVQPSNLDRLERELPRPDIRPRCSNLRPSRRRQDEEFRIHFLTGGPCQNPST